MKTPCLLAICLVSLALTAPVRAADYSDPTWPCVQRKVERLSIGLMWPAPIEDQDLAPEQAADAEELASILILRRVDLDDATARVADFADTHGRDPALMGHVFAKVFNGLNTRRAMLIEGIADYSLKQIAMSDRIEEARVKMDTLMAADAPDFDQVDQIEEQLDWDERIYTDRQRALTYVCETPVLLEKRLYALAQILMDASKE